MQEIPVKQCFFNLFKFEYFTFILWFLLGTFAASHLTIFYDFFYNEGI